MELDLVFKDGLVVDGTGGPAFVADVGIADGSICAVGRLAPVAAARSIDARGLIVAPGFVDMHTHSDVRLLDEPRAEAKTMQGVTTEVIGQDGLSLAPVNARTMEMIRQQTAAWNGEPTKKPNPAIPAIALHTITLHLIVFCARSYFSTVVILCI